MQHIVISVTNTVDYDQRMLRTASHLQSMGFDIKFIGRSKKGMNTLPSSFDIDRINCWFNKGLLFYLEFNIKLFFQLLHYKNSLLLSVDQDTLLANWLCKKINGNILIIDLHELFTEVPELQHRVIKKKLWQIIERLGIKSSDVRYTVNHSIAAYYSAKYQLNFEVVRNVPLPYPLIEINSRLHPLTIVYLGALNAGRGIMELLDVLRELDDVELILIGKGDLYNEIVQKIESNKLSDRVQLTGWKTKEEIIQILPTADIGVNLLNRDSQSYYLSLANKYFDYIQAGLPAINMDFPEYQKLESQYETSILIPDLKKSSIASAILTLKNDQEYYSRLKANCLAARASWHWNDEKEQLSQIFSPWTN